MKRLGHTLTSQPNTRLRAGVGYGEFARTNSVAGYHNATLTAIAL